VFMTFKVRFLDLFNVLYDENMKLPLQKSELLQEKMLNWNKINGAICFTYLQQQFFLVQESMKALASGKKEKITIATIKKLIQTTQGNQFDTYLDDEGIRDIADVLTSDKDLFDEGEEPSGMIESPPRKEKLPKSLREDDELAQSKRSEQFSHLQEEESKA